MKGELPQWWSWGAAAVRMASPGCGTQRCQRVWVARAWVQWGEQNCSVLVQLLSICLSNCYPDPLQ